MSKTAFITGIAGQDGSYLTEYLLELGYRVTGIIRRNSIVENQRDRIAHLNDVEIAYGDLLDQTSIYSALRRFQPDLIFNLAAQSHVRISFDLPLFTVQTNSIGTMNVLEAYKATIPTAKFYQASSSEMFGNSMDYDGFQREATPMHPVSPYGCSKLFSYNISRHYRSAYGLFISNGILFNHESPRRGSNFVTNKIVKTAVEIKMGLAERLELGNLDTHRDWGHSYDYVRAMYAILKNSSPKDYVVSTGETHSVRELCETVFRELDMNYEDYVIQNPKFMRPEELKYLRGDSTAIRRELGWEPKYTFEDMLKEMIDHWTQALSR
jgi:GDPmannose 4,6-dehydratase